MAKYAALRERALANFEALLDLWQITFTKISNDEYDFLNPTRKDNNYGACRFNVAKGIGSDFAGTNFTSADYKSLGPGFTKDDFAGYNQHTGISTTWGFDIIGLCQRLRGSSTYKDAATELRDNLKSIKSNGKYNPASADAARQRDAQRTENKKKILASAQKTWNYCKDFEGTLADVYLRSRKLYFKGNAPEIKFHPKIYNTELKTFIPAVLFKISKSPESEFLGVHRIYIARDGSRKAHLTNPKMALGSIKGAAIWFGTPDKTLHIVEGPENALTIKYLGYSFVACTISAANFGNLSIPNYVNDVKLFPDPDKAGKEAALKAVDAYQRQGKTVTIVMPPKRTLDNGKLADWNDVLMGKGVEDGDKGQRAQ